MIKVTQQMLTDAGYTYYNQLPHLCDDLSDDEEIVKVGEVCLIGDRYCNCASNFDQRDLADLADLGLMTIQSTSTPIYRKIVASAVAAANFEVKIGDVFVLRRDDWTVPAGTLFTVDRVYLLSTALVPAERPNVVVLDVMMPGLSGWEISRYVRDASILGGLHAGKLQIIYTADELKQAVICGMFNRVAVNNAGVFEASPSVTVRKAETAEERAAEEHRKMMAFFFPKR